MSVHIEEVSLTSVLALAWLFIFFLCLSMQLCCDEAVTLLLCFLGSFNEVIVLQGASDARCWLMCSPGSGIPAAPSVQSGPTPEPSPTDVVAGDGEKDTLSSACWFRMGIDSLQVGASVFYFTDEAR